VPIGSSIDGRGSSWKVVALMYNPAQFFDADSENTLQYLQGQAIQVLTAGRGTAYGSRMDISRWETVCGSGVVILRCIPTDRDI
jgi:hypothetical protein